MSTAGRSVGVALGSVVASGVGVALGVAADPVVSVMIPTPVTWVTLNPSLVTLAGFRSGRDAADETTQVTTTAAIATTATTAVTMVAVRIARARDCRACTCCAFSRTASRRSRGPAEFGDSSLDMEPLGSYGGRKSAGDCGEGGPG